ncbi:MAG: adenylate/guanylate cyclase domain-containing protein [Acidiferrobacterales bacterium]
MAEENVTRKLTAILYADVAGYSRLTGEDEVGTHKQLSAGLDLISGAIKAKGGNVVHYAGDAVLADFGSVVAAVDCAVSIQRQLAESNAQVADDQRLQFRIGVNLGEVIVDRDDIYGDGVNVAARIESLAEPGGICVSANVHDQVRKKIDLLFEDMGEQQVKNITEAVHVFRIRLGEVPSQTPLAFPDKPSIAVLPFDNMSGDPEQEYFSDGLSEDIITLLSAWRSFPVIARNSSFAYKGQSRDVRQIAKELSARYVIEGSVRKSGNRVRITAQLIDAETGHHLWAEKFDGVLDDIFEIQDEITRRIVSLVEPQMEVAERKKAEAKRSSNLSAWDYYLRGRAHLHMVTPDDNAQARTMFEKAIELDPNYSDAFAGLSYTFQRDILLEVVEDRKAWENKALDAARRAEALDNGSSLAHLALSGAYIWSNQHEQSIAETRTAVELNPSNVHARLALGNRLDIVGASEEGIPLLEETLQLNPRDPHSHIYYGQLARAYINERNYDKALSCLRESLQRNPDYPHTYHILAICLGHLGRVDEAQEAARQCEQLRPGFMKKRANWNIYVDPAANQHLTEGLRKAGLLE